MWSLVPLSKILTERTETARSTDLENENLKIISKIGFNDGKIQFRVDRKSRTGMIFIEPGDLVISGINAIKGAIAVYETEEKNPIAATIHYSAYKPNNEMVDVKFLWFVLRSNIFRDILKIHLSDGIKTELNAHKLLTISIPLPSLDEQKKLVKKIYDLFSKIEEINILRAESQQLINLLKSNLSESIFDIIRESNSESRLGDLTTRITKGESPAWQGFSYQETGPLFIRSENVLWGKLDVIKQKRIPLEFHEKLKRSQLNPGDILINLVGASIGRSCIVPDDINLANINQAVATITPKYNILSSKYLMYYLISKTAQDKIHSGKVETARPNISLGDLRELKIPLPSIIEQNIISARIEEFNKKINMIGSLQTETMEEIQLLKSIILNNHLLKNS